MKVICITNKPLHDSRFNDSLSRLVEGETYTVISKVCKFGEGYVLSEVKSSSPDGAFHVKRFIPLSDICETTFERNILKETV